MHEVLFRDLYRGIVTWNRSRKRNTWGAHEQTARPEPEWIAVPVPALRIISDAQWHAVHGRIAAARADYARDTHGRRGGRPRRDIESKYLLPGFARCALCQGGLHVRSRSHGSTRAFFYACTSHYTRGPEICPHVELWPMDAINAELLAAIAGDVLQPALAEEVVERARRHFEAAARDDRREQLQRDLVRVEREQARLADAIASIGGNIPVLAARLREAENRRLELATTLENLGRTARPDWRAVDRRLRAHLGEWRRRFEAGNVANARQALRELLVGPVLFTPIVEGGRRGIRFEGQVDEGVLFGGEVVVTTVASPMGRTTSPLRVDRVLVPAA